MDLDSENLERMRVSAGLMPASWMPQVRLARVLRQLDGRWDEAWRAATRAVELAPAEPRTHFIAGLLALDRKRHRQAAAAFRRVRELRPDSVAGLVNLAVALLRGPGRVSPGYDPAWPVTSTQAEQFQVRLWLAGRLVAAIGLVWVLLLALEPGVPPVPALVLGTGLATVVARWLWHRTTSSLWRLLPRMMRYDTYFAMELVLVAGAASLFAVAVGLAFAGSEMAWVAVGAGVLVLAGDELIDRLRWSVLMFRHGPTIEPIGLLLEALRQRPDDPLAERGLDVAIWRLLARLWLASMILWASLAYLLSASPPMVARTVALLGTAVAVVVALWWSTPRRIPRPVAPQVLPLVRHDPLLPVAFCGTLVSVLGWAGLAVSAGSIVALPIVIGTGGLLLVVAMLYVLRVVLAFLLRVSHRVGIRARWLYTFPPHPRALLAYDRLERTGGRPARP